MPPVSSQTLPLPTVHPVPAVRPVPAVPARPAWQSAPSLVLSHVVLLPVALVLPWWAPGPIQAIAAGAQVPPVGALIELSCLLLAKAFLAVYGFSVWQGWKAHLERAPRAWVWGWGLALPWGWLGLLAAAGALLKVAVWICQRVDQVVLV